MTWLALLRRVYTPRTPSTRRPRVRPTLDVLEDRLAPAVFTVTTTLDDFDSGGAAAAGAGPDGVLSLREAVSLANQTNDGTANVIVLPAGTFNLTRAGVGE